MLDIPYFKNPGKACALACYAMTANYFFSGTTFEEIARISDWTPGYIIWPFKFWLWIMDQGVKVTDYDLINLEEWAQAGIAGLQNSINEKEFNFYIAGTKDIDACQNDIIKIIKHPNFIYHQRKPNFEDLESHFRTGAVCEAVLDSKTLDRETGFSLHRVVILDVNEEFVLFHDPRQEPRPSRRESRKLFKRAWLDIDEPELCVYKLRS